MTRTLTRSGLCSAGFFALLPAAAGAGGLAIAPLVGIAGVAGADLGMLRAAAFRQRSILILLLALTVWAAASSFWSPYPNHSQATRLIETVLSGLLFAVAASGADASRKVTASAGVAAIAVLAVVLAIEALGGMPFNRAAQPQAIDWLLMRNPARGGAVLTILVWAVLGRLLSQPGWRRWLGIGLAAAAGALTHAFQMDASPAAFAAGAIAFAAGWAAPALAMRALTGALALWFAVAPFALRLLPLSPSFALPNSWLERLHIWKFASDRTFEAPLLGHGLDASRTYHPDILLHPHNVALQIWLETGAVGAVLACALLLMGGNAMARALATRRTQAASACGTLAAFAVYSNLSFGAWQEWWVATAFVAAALVAASTSAKA